MSVFSFAPPPQASCWSGNTSEIAAEPVEDVRAPSSCVRSSARLSFPRLACSQDRRHRSPGTSPGPDAPSPARGGVAPGDVLDLDDLRAPVAQDGRGRGDEGVVGHIQECGFPPSGDGCSCAGVLRELGRGATPAGYEITHEECAGRDRVICIGIQLRPWLRTLEDGPIRAMKDQRGARAARRERRRPWWSPSPRFRQEALAEAYRRHSDGPRFGMAVRVLHEPRAGRGDRAGALPPPLERPGEVRSGPGGRCVRS